MVDTRSEAILFSGTSHPELAKEIADLLGIKLGQISIDRFPDGENSIQILESVRGRDVFILQSIALDPNNYLMELLIIIDALKRASARSIAAVLPYYGYCRQDRKDKPRVPITAKLVANLLERAGTTRVLTMDLHAGQIQGFFNVPVDNLPGKPLLAKALQELSPKNLVIVAPDIGSIKRARAYAKYFNCELAVIDKSRIGANEVKTLCIIGDVQGKDVLLADDMCSTGRTLVSAAKACREKGAKRIFAAVTHGLLVGDAIEQIDKSPIEALLISNTIQHVDRAQSEKIHVVSIAPLLSQAISCIISRDSIPSLYDDKDF